jgi:hypothetical protein
MVAFRLWSLLFLWGATDAKGYQENYAYDEFHSGILV